MNSEGTVKNVLWHWGGMFYSTFTILLASIHVIMIPKPKWPLHGKWFAHREGILIAFWS